MNKIRAKAIPITEKEYLCLAKIITIAEYLPGYRNKLKLSGDWEGTVICLDELGKGISLTDIIVEDAPEVQPYFLEVNGALLVTEDHPHSRFNFYPCVGNAKGFEYDSYTEPSEQECLFKITSTRDEDQFVEGLYFTEDAGSIELWTDGSIDIFRYPWAP